MAICIYKSLRSRANGLQIRLCYLQPATPPAPIKCEIEVHDFDDHLEYEALSYAWGDSSDPTTIEVNGRDVPVTKNLGTALRYLRGESEARTLWIDAICINQDDIKERSAQVAVMGKIYHKAIRVISWLGVHDSLIDPLQEIEYVAVLLRNIQFLKSHATFQQYLDRKGLKDSSPELQDHLNELDDGLYSLQLLIGERRERPWYWQRAWITQEVSSSRSWMLQSGSYTISDDDVNLVADILKSPAIKLLFRERLEERRLNASLNVESFLPISVYRSLLYHESGLIVPALSPRKLGLWTLTNLLRYNRSQLCSDPKDKVFSILGISDLASSSHPGIEVNYSRTESEVFTGAVQAIIESSSSLDILCSANLAESTLLPNLPTWVPNWNVHKIRTEATRPISYGQQYATGPTASRVRFKTCAGKEILSAIGFRFGTVLDFKDRFVDFDLDSISSTEAHLTVFVQLYRQLPYIFRTARDMVHPRPLSGSSFRNTFSLGLLSHKLNDSFQELIDDLDFKAPADESSKRPIKLAGMRYRYRTMASSLNRQCLFAVEPRPLAESSQLLNGIIGIAPSDVVQKGDILSLLLGCNAPVILRPVDNRFVLVCAAYVESLMNGSAMDYMENGLFELESFDIE